MRTSSLAALVVALMAGGCSGRPLEMAGFAAPAARGEVVELRGVGWGRSGDFSIEPLGVTGHFHRGASSTDLLGSQLAEGGVNFTLQRAGGSIEGQCAFSQETVKDRERLGRRTTIETTAITAPYLYTCGFYRSGQDIGGLELRELPGEAFDVRTMRAGAVQVDGAELTLRSVHRFAHSRMPTEMPLGYVMSGADGEHAALYLNGSTRRFALPAVGAAEREAALLAGVALALVWDPGDGS